VGQKDKEGSTEVINLREDKSGDSALLLAIREGQLELVCMILDAGSHIFFF
jgi:ankyrin repeat protein